MAHALTVGDIVRVKDGTAVVLTDQIKGTTGVELFLVEKKEALFYPFDQITLDVETPTNRAWADYTVAAAEMILTELRNDADAGEPMTWLIEGAKERVNRLLQRALYDYGLLEGVR